VQRRGDASPISRPREPTRSNAGARVRFLLTPFQVEQCALSRYSPTVSSQIAIAPDHPVTRHNHRHRIRGAGASYRPGSSRQSQCLGDFGVGSSLTGRNSAQIGPHAVLEWRASRIEPYIGPADAALEARADPLSPLAEPARVLQYPSIGKFGPELGFECGIGITQNNAHTPRSVAAIMTRPTGESSTAYRIVGPRSGSVGRLFSFPVWAACIKSRRVLSPCKLSGNLVAVIVSSRDNIGT
jgi:hypothetical protein